MRFTLKIFFSLCVCGNSLNGFAQGAWTQKANFGGVSRQFAVGFSVGTKGYIGTGDNNVSTAYMDFWEWDQSTNLWSQKANFISGPSSGNVAFGIGNKGYVLPYSGGSNCLHEYDPSNNIWTQLGYGPGGGPTNVRSVAFAFVIGNSAYVGTGQNSMNLFQDFWQYNPVNDTWTQKANYGGSYTSGAVAFSIGSKGYAGTGWGGSASKMDFWEYDTLSNAWTQKANFAGLYRQNCSAFSLGNKGYLGAGLDYMGNYRKDFWEYDPSNDTWTQVANLTGSTRYGAVSFSIGNYGYVGTGYNGTLKNDFWEYTPSAVGLNDISSQEHTTTVYPNPFWDEATFSFEKELSKATLIIYDINGKEVELLNFSGNKVILERKNLESGLYCYNITESGNNISAGKIIIR